jgi:hypothetical protein
MHFAIMNLKLRKANKIEIAKIPDVRSDGDVVMVNSVDAASQGNHLRQKN